MAGYVQLGPVRTWYEERGQGEPLVPLHGGMSDARDLAAKIDTAVVAEHLGGADEAARTAAALYSGVLLLLAVAFGGLFAWITRTDRCCTRCTRPSWEPLPDPVLDG